MHTGYLNNQFLIAMPGLSDPHFSQTVTYICEHNQDGAMGLVLNRPTRFQCGDLFKQLQLPVIDKPLAQKNLLYGGPVQPEHGFILHRHCASNWEASMVVSSDVSLTSSRDILQALSRGQGPKDFIITLGYAGWGAGQLEQEILNNSWLTVEARADIIFSTPPAALWQTSAELIGVDFTRMSHIVGHA